MALPKFVVYHLLQTYHELGEYHFKVVLNQRYYKSGHGFTVRMVDSSRKPMQCKTEIWGRKLNVSFKIDDSVSDGVSYAEILKGDNTIATLKFWVVKP